MAWNWNDRYGGDKEPPHSEDVRESVSGRMQTALQRHGRGRIFLATFGVLAALLVVCAVIMSASYRRFGFAGEVLRLVSVTRSDVTMAAPDGSLAVLSVTVTDVHLGFTSLRVTYRDRVITRDDANFLADYAAVYTFSDGTRWYLPRMAVRFSDGSDNLPPLSQLGRAERSLMQQMQNYHAERRTRGTYVWATVRAMLMLVFGMVNVFYPRVLWRLRTFLHVRGGEPTDFYTAVSVVSGVILVAAAFIFLFAAVG